MGHSDSAVAATPQKLRFTRQRYDRMVDAGIFTSKDHIELLDGEIVEMPPQKSLHATATGLIHQALADSIGKDHHVRTQMPIALSEDSEPEPDIAVVRGTFRDYRDEHPTRAELIIEVADSSLAYDRGRKSAAYARAGIPEYWILNVQARVLEVQRDPADGVYRQRFVLSADDVMTPLVAPALAIRLADVLP